MAVEKNEIFSNLIWRFAERFGAQIITFVVNLVLARILLPEDYGMVAMINVVIVILQVFVDSGLGNALIQKPGADDLDFSTVFFFNMGMCTLIYALLCMAAPWIAEFYKNPAMTPVIRVVGLTLVVSGVKNVQQAYVSRNLLFKTFFFATLGGTLFSAVVGIFLACQGAGVWALAAQHLTNLCMDTVILWIMVKWRPKLLFSWQRFRALFSFGWKLLASSLLETVYNNLQNLIIGKKYTSADLAYYQRGDQFPSLLVTNINTSIGSVLFPAMAREQDDRESLRAHVRRAISVSSYLLWPLMVGLAVCAEPLVRLLLTDKWLPAVPYMQIACFVYGLMPIHTTNLQAITAMGRSDWYLRLEIIKKTVGLTVLLIAMHFGVLAIAASAIFTGCLGTFLNSWPNRKLLGYSFQEQLRDIAPSLFLSAFMGLIVWQVNRLSLSPLPTLLIQVPLGAAVYLLGSRIFHLESYEYVLSAVKPLLGRLRRIR